VTAGGKRHARGGAFYEPTVLSGCDASMRISYEETFGPVARCSASRPRRR
jgi:succinate-semialdehyde dehydrogenase/glutarate-semialdehyde dehydrogenase